MNCSSIRIASVSAISPSAIRGSSARRRSMTLADLIRPTVPRPPPAVVVRAYEGGSSVGMTPDRTCDRRQKAGGCRSLDAIHHTRREAPMRKLTNFVLAHKRVVATFWIVLTIAGMFGASRVTDRLDDQFSMPSSEAFATNQEIEDRFSSGGMVEPLVAVVELPAGVSAEDPAVRSDLRALEGRLTHALPGARTASYGSTGGDAFVSDDGQTTYAVVHPKVDNESSPGPAEIDSQMIESAQSATDRGSVGGAEVMLTGRAVLEQAPEDEGGSPSFLNETLIAGVGALGVLAFVFASALALVPLLMAIVAIPITLLAVLGLTAITDVSFIVVFLVSLIGLGIAIDYALIVVMRWREERERGLSNEDAIRAAAATSGRAVVFSGTTVAIGLLAAVVLPIPFLQSMAYGGLLIPLVSVAVALTLLPVVLATVGPRADRRRLRRTERAERHWASWARLVVRHRVAAVVTGVAALVALVAVAGGVILGDPEADALGGSGQAKAGLETLDGSGIGASPLTPVEVIAPADDADRTARELPDAGGGPRGPAPGAQR